jgi:hypothetical protein
MKIRKSPQIKKQDEYEKTHRTRMENPHAFRKNWAKKKARVNRQERVAVRSMLASTEDDELTGKLLKHICHRHTIRKTHVMPLREFLAERWQQRVLKQRKGM